MLAIAIWGWTGLVVAGTDLVLHDTYYVVAPAHYALTLATLFGVFAGWYYVFPRITGRAYSDFLGRFHFWLSFIGVSAMLVPPIVGPASLARRAAEEPDVLRNWNLVSSIGASVAAAGMLVFVANMVLAFTRRQRAD